MSAVCTVDRRGMCYHAAVPAVDWRSGEVPKAGAHVNVPLWEAGEVIAWVPAVVLEQHLHGISLVRLTDGSVTTMGAYSIGRPGTGGRITVPETVTRLKHQQGGWCV